jgi:hypothetical protein
MCSYTLVIQNRKERVFVLSYVRLRNVNTPTKLAVHIRQYGRPTDNGCEVCQGDLLATAATVADHPPPGRD